MPLRPWPRSHNRRASTFSSCWSAWGRKAPPAGELASRLSVPQNTLSAHLSVLSRAGLVAGERRSRFIIYRADIARLQEMMLFLLKDCCGGKADICAPLVANLTPCKGSAHD